MILNDVKVVFLNQSAGETVHELVDECADKIGKTLFITGSRIRESKDNLIMVYAPKYNNSSLLSRFRTWIAYFIYTLKILRNIKGNPVLVISSNPPFLPLIGNIYKILRGWKYIVWVLDIYPDAFAQNGLISAKNPVYKIWSYMNRKMYKQANHIVTLGNIMAKRVSKYIYSNSEIDIFPNWANTEEYHPILKNNNWFAKEHFNLNHLSVIYSGNLGLTHDIKTVFEGAKLMQKQKNISFLIIGGGVRKKEIISQSKVLTNLEYLPFQSEETLPFSLASADIAIILLGKGTEGISMPSKLYYSLATGCAILGISDGNNDLKHTIEEQNCGINIENDDVKGFIDAIMKFKNDKPFLIKCKENSRKAALEHFSSSVVIPQFTNIINKLLNQNLN